MLVSEFQKHLEEKYGIVPDDFYDDGETVVLFRSGMDKIAGCSGIIFNMIDVVAVPYGKEMGVVVRMVAREPGDGLWYPATASATPDNYRVLYGDYAEMAEIRCRHRLLLHITDLYQRNVRSEHDPR